jgi:hypothetical protein
MKLFTCNNCNNTLYFENTLCLKCNNPVGFDSLSLSMLTMNRNPNNNTLTDTQNNKSYKYCYNKHEHTCNWIIPTENYANYCVACELNRTIPTLSEAQNRERWHKIELAKHRLIYSLLKLHLPLKRKLNSSVEGLAFDFTTDTSAIKKVITGHYAGLITLNTNEADEVERAKSKYDLNEKYRTIIGHFRHEIGHYYWDVLIQDNITLLAEFRLLFGDERMNYSDALQNYYNASNKNKSNHFISYYASSHPWEDWAESWAHYMHLMDAIETAYFFGLQLDPNAITQRNINTPAMMDPYEVEDFNDIFNMWIPLSSAVNAMNKSMGHAEFYPFVISKEVVTKLSFIHQLCRNQ